MGRYDEAVKNLLKAIELKRDFPDAYNNLGAALFRRKRYGEAARAFKEAVRKNTSSNNDEFIKNLREAERLSGRGGR